jgi:hypothetical protein
MMTILTAAGAVLFTLTCLTVGIRLLILARRTRELPELLMGISFLTGGVMSYVLAGVFAYFETPGLWGVLLGTVGRLVYIASPVAMAVAGWRVFRPNAPWAGLVVGSVVTVNLLYVVRPFLIGDMVRAELVRNPMYWISTAAQIFPWAWVAVESFLLHRNLSKRARLGLAQDPALAHRMLMWTIGLGTVVLLTISMEATSLAAALGLPHIPMNPIIIVLGLTCAVSLWRAFFASRARIAYS